MDWEYYRRANKSIAQGSLTNSKRVECLIKGVTPTHVTHGNGCFLFDTNGKRYTDFICGLGSNLFGYANPHINKAIKSQLDKGTVYSLGSTLEVEAAELVKNYFPFVSKVRFLKTGTEAAGAAVRIALAHTARKRILSTGYHGWLDPFVSLSPPSVGVPKQTHIEQFVSLDQLKSDIACLILEPIVTDYSDKRTEWLQLVMAKCKKNGILVIFDEIITGFRWPRLSFATDSGLHPDIILLGKACGGGMPLSIVGLGPGIGDDKEWFVSSTFAGETLSLVVMKQVFKLLENNYLIKDLWRDGKEFQDEFNSLYPSKIQMVGYPTRGVFEGDLQTKALLWQEAANAGVLFGPSFFFCFPHMEQLKTVMGSLKDIIRRIKNNEVKLTGELPTSPFSQKARENQ